MSKFHHFLKALKCHFTMIIFMGLLFGALGASFVYYFYNPKNVTYEMTFISNSQIDISYDYINKIKIDLENERIEGQYVAENGEIKYPYSSFSYIDVKKVYNGTKIIYFNDYITIKTEKRNFNSWQQARRFLRKIVLDTDEDATFKLNNGTYSKIDNEKSIENSSIALNEGFKEYLFFIMGFIGGVGLGLVIIFILSLKLKDVIIDKVNYDNINIYKTPFHYSYFKSSFKELRNLKSMVTISVLFALMICTKFISLPSGFSNLGIGLGYLVFSVIAMLYGPCAGILIGFLSDNIGFLIKPSGVYFPGYTISAIIAGLTYALCLYKTKITFMKCLFSRIVVNFLVNTLLGTYWWWLINDKTISFKAYLLTAELPKNIVYLFPQSILIFVLIKILSKPLKVMGLLNEEIADNITIF